MTIRSRFAALLFAALLLALAQHAGAQEPARKLPSQKPPAARATQKEPADKEESRQETLPTADEELRKTLDLLTAELKSLGAEVQKLRRVTDRNAQTMELLLSEERLSKLEDKIQEATDRKPQLDAREQDLQRRMRNIPNELLTRGGLRREEAEAAAKADLQRALDEVHSQQSINQQRIVESSAQAERLRARVEALRKRIDPAEPTGEKQNR